MSKYGVISGPHFPAFGLNTDSVFSPNAGKYGREKTPYLDIFHAVMLGELSRDAAVFAIHAFSTSALMSLCFLILEDVVQTLC